MIEVSSLSSLLRATRKTARAPVTSYLHDEFPSVDLIALVSGPKLENVIANFCAFRIDRRIEPGMVPELARDLESK